MGNHYTVNASKILESVLAKAEPKAADLQSAMVHACKTFGFLEDDANHERFKLDPGIPDQLRNYAGDCEQIAREVAVLLRTAGVSAVTVESYVLPRIRRMRDDLDMCQITGDAIRRDIVVLRQFICAEAKDGELTKLIKRRKVVLALEAVVGGTAVAIATTPPVGASVVAVAALGYCGKSMWERVIQEWKDGRD